MAKEIVRDGNRGVFKDDATEEEINAYFESLKEPETPKEPDEPKEEDGKRGILTDVPVQIMGGVRDGTQSTIGLWEKVSEDLSDITNIGGWVFGEDAKDGWVDYVTAKEAKERGTKFIGSGKIGEKDAFQLPKVDEADTITGGLSRGVSQFLMGWFTGGRLIKGGKGLLTSLGKGAIADVQAFDSDTGRFADMINTFAPSLQNPLLDYLASDEDETFYESRLKNAIEGLFLGGITEGILRSTPHVKDQVLNTIKYLKLNRAKLSGKKS